MSERLALRLLLCRARRLLFGTNLAPFVLELVDDMLGNGRLIAVGRLLHALLQGLDVAVSSSLTRLKLSVNQALKHFKRLN